ncbi:hypothetical protein HMPREF2626_01495 [Aerococcus sp. HMSC062A02]|uniref:winged helix-turn-helix domain-containing protein n=1 Tax=Aerococcus sp. HMSC062A02 TaxID=1715105 RepID=UPI0008A4F5DB|nr:winged helix-turn-helix domain-containing protein [Aerococcus sp. HMSC062A02]OFN02612.1 hypothetical protein HMPREF2626_01495 [Aerococcus sp. HMSC062A02]
MIGEQIEGLSPNGYTVRGTVIKELKYTWLVESNKNLELIYKISAPDWQDKQNAKSPGAKLKDLRRQCQLTIPAAADRVNRSSRIVMLIEQDAYQGSDKESIVGKLKEYYMDYQERVSGEPSDEPIEEILRQLNDDTPIPDDGYTWKPNVEGQSLSNKGWTDQEKDTLVALYEKGESLKEISEILGRTYYGTKSQLEQLRKEGRMWKRPRIREKRKKRKEWSDGDTERLIEMENKGLPYIEIASALGFSIGTIAQRIKRFREEGVM